MRIKFFSCFLLPFALSLNIKAQEFILMNKVYHGRMILSDDNKYEIIVNRGMHFFESRGVYRISKDKKRILLTSTHQRDSVNFTYEQGEENMLRIGLFGFEEIPIHAKIIVDDSLKSSTINGQCEFQLTNWNKCEIIPDYSRSTYDTIRINNNGHNLIKVQTLNSLVISENFVFLRNSSFKVKKNKIIDSNKNILGDRNLVFVAK